eukprot:scaffold2224_cov261-Pinguiococcus_pyrenoidosus.AAC.12
MARLFIADDSLKPWVMVSVALSPRSRLTPVRDVKLPSTTASGLVGDTGDTFPSFVVISTVQVWPPAGLGPLSHKPSAQLSWGAVRSTSAYSTSGKASKASRTCSAAEFAGRPPVKWPLKPSVKWPPSLFPS